MSKVVKGVVRAVKKVVSGIGKAVKKVMKSPIGRVIAIAALTFVGAPMLAGAMQGAAAGSGFLGTISGALSGAASGFSAAMSGIGTAISTGLSQGIGAGFDSLMAGSATNFGMGTVGEGFAALTGGAEAAGAGTGFASTGSEMAGLSGAEAYGSAPAVSSPVNLGALEATPIDAALPATPFEAAADTVSWSPGMDVGSVTNAAADTSTSMWSNPSSLQYGSQVADPGYAAALEGQAYVPGAEYLGDSPGMIDKVLGVVKDYKIGPSLVFTGGQMLAGAMQGKAQQEQIAAQERQRQEDLQRMYDNYKFSWRVGPDGRFYVA
jgi:hypothetical protein